MLALVVLSPSIPAEVPLPSCSTSVSIVSSAVLSLESPKAKRAVFEPALRAEYTTLSSARNIPAARVDAEAASS